MGFFTLFCFDVFCKLLLGFENYQLDFCVRLHDIVGMKLNPEKLVEARGLADLSQQKLADKIGVNRATVAGYERANLSPRMTTIHRLAKALGASVEFLCDTASQPGAPARRSDELKWSDEKKQAFKEIMLESGALELVSEALQAKKTGIDEDGAEYAEMMGKLGKRLVEKVPPWLAENIDD